MEEFKCTDGLAASFVEALLAWPNLRQLDVTFNEPLRKDDTARLLRHCPLLRHCRIIAPSPPALFHEPVLGNRKPPPSAPNVSELKHLERLQLIGCAVDDALFAAFGFPRLEELEMTTTGVQVLWFENALARMPECRRLTIGAGADVRLVNSAQRPTKLRVLSIHSFSCNARDWWFLLRSAPSLVELNISKQAAVGFAELRMIPAQNLRKLERAQLCAEPDTQIGAEVITAFIELCPELQILSIDARITAATIDELVATHRGRKRAVPLELRDGIVTWTQPQLMIFDASGCRKTAAPNPVEA